MLRLAKPILAALVAHSIALPTAAQEKRHPITVGDAVGVAQALRSLKTYVALDKAGARVELPYKFSGSVLFDMATNIYRGDVVAKVYQDAINSLVLQHSGGAAQVPADKMQEFQRQVSKLAEEPAKVEFVRIKRGDLNLAQQPILNQNQAMFEV